MDTKQNINITLGKNSVIITKQSEKWNRIKWSSGRSLYIVTTVTKANETAQDKETIWMTLRRFIKVMYFKGFTTAM